MLFNRIKKMTDVLVKKIDKIEVESNKCLKVRAVTSSCSACIDVCPVNSIRIKRDSVELEQPCLGCGLCTTVCPSNALKWNHPPLMQLLNQVLRLSEKEPVVYLTCSSFMKENHLSNVVEVPCLGMIPTEFWISLGLNTSNLRIIYDTKRCHSCEVSGGEDLFLQQYKEAERSVKQPFHVCSSIMKENTADGALVDHSRRRLFTSLLEEVKETNTITVKEVLEVAKPLSPFEKFERHYQKQSEIEEVVETIHDIKSAVADRLLDDSVVTTDKRAILFNEWIKHPEIQKEMTFLIPEVNDECTLCGACTFLCPTDALTMDHDSIILSTNKCVSCQLCAEICYENHMSMVSKTGTIFKEKFMYLIKK